MRLALSILSTRDTLFAFFTFYMTCWMHVTCLLQRGVGPQLHHMDSAGIGTSTTWCTIQCSQPRSKMPSALRMAQIFHWCELLLMEHLGTLLFIPQILETLESARLSVLSPLALLCRKCLLLLSRSDKKKIQPFPWKLQSNSLCIPWQRSNVFDTYRTRRRTEAQTVCA